MASDRTYEFNGQKGHWYTDDQGNRYFVAQGQTPKEGWEATKRRKMIKGGKYLKDDGDDKGEQEISANEYQTYEADEEERFDETTDADFEDPEPEGFDRDDDDERSWGPDQPEDEIWAKFDEWQKYAFAEDQTPENIEKGNKLSEEWSEGLYDYMTDDQKKEFERIYDTADPDELEKFVANVIGNRRNSRGSDESGLSTEKGKKKNPFGDREIPYTAGEIEDEDNAEYLKGKDSESQRNLQREVQKDLDRYGSVTSDTKLKAERMGFKIDDDGKVVVDEDIRAKADRVTGGGRGPQTANIDANVDDIAKEVASKFGEANVKVNEDGHILLKDPEGFEPVAIANEDEIPAGAIVKIMPDWREPNENADDTYFVKEDRGDRLLLWSPSKSSSFGGYTYVWPKNTMYVPPRMRGGNPNPTEGKQGPVEKQESEGSKSIVDEAFEYAKGLFDDPKTRDKAINMMVEKYPNASDDEIGQAVTKLISYWKGKR